MLPMQEKLEEIDYHLFVRRTIAFEGDVWEFRASRLGIPYGISTSLTLEGGAYGSAMWLDWPNILQEPDRARINILVMLFQIPDKDYHKSFADSYARTSEVLKSIKVYDSIMQNRHSRYNRFEIEEMLRSGQLPRPEVALIDADRPRLDEFFRQEGFLQGDRYYHGAFSIPWSRLVEMALEGRIPLY